MKKFLYVVLGLAFLGCNTNNLKSDSMDAAAPTTNRIVNAQLTKEDAEFVNAINNLKNEGNKSEDGFGKKIAMADAKECEREYVKAVANGDLKKDNVAKKKITESVTFNLSKVMAWLSEKKIENSDQLKISFGVYTKAYVAKYNLTEDKVGRLVVFLWNVKAIKGDKIVFNEGGAEGDPNGDPLNIGELRP